MHGADLVGQPGLPNRALGRGGIRAPSIVQSLRVPGISRRVAVPIKILKNTSPAPGDDEGHCRGNGGCHHHGSSTTSMDATHFTHQNPRRPGATSRAGPPCPAESGRPEACVASSSVPASRAGKRRR